jgi:hypothetical protein
MTEDIIEVSEPGRRSRPGQPVGVRHRQPKTSTLLLGSAMRWSLSGRPGSNPDPASSGRTAAAPMRSPPSSPCWKARQARSGTTSGQFEIRRQKTIARNSG